MTHFIGSAARHTATRGGAPLPEGPRITAALAAEPGTHSGFVDSRGQRTLRWRPNVVAPSFTFADGRHISRRAAANRCWRCPSRRDQRARPEAQHRLLRQSLGLNPVRRTGFRQVLACGAVSVHLFQAPEPATAEAARNWRQIGLQHVAFMTPDADLDAIKDRLMHHGIHTDGPVTDADGRGLYLRDPDGIVIELRAPRKPRCAKRRRRDHRPSLVRTRAA